MTRFFIRRVVAVAFAFLLPTIANIALSQDNAVEPATEYRIEGLNNKPVSETLDLTYRILGKGNRNYNGHRIEAMAEIKLAATLLKIKLPARERGGSEDQKTSDARITLSLRLLDQLRPRLADQDQQEAIEHINQAMKELSQALEVRAAAEAAHAEAAASHP